MEIQAPKIQPFRVPSSLPESRLTASAMATTTAP